MSKEKSNNIYIVPNFELGKADPEKVAKSLQQLDNFYRKKGLNQPTNLHLTHTTPSRGSSHE